MACRALLVVHQLTSRDLVGVRSASCLPCTKHLAHLQCYLSQLPGIISIRREAGILLGEVRKPSIREAPRAVFTVVLPIRG